MARVVTMREAIADHITEGDFISIGGDVCRPLFAAIHEIIRQGKKV